ncbi:hypothetical protein GN244_ATG02506 [Phytophthora infestans]|uniref:Uncharacterized protein n=1 Tax=Phytophthora infestans TaxID=4787 RepID=A0A833T0W1_PHYIN|nr:hypothetical protein GN244_ATG02506 [Phytophthora infestans]KAF4149923.1 hypothetical protein GN958_ATG00862 [Phytophthora infestans]
MYEESTFNMHAKLRGNSFELPHLSTSKPRRKTISDTVVVDIAALMAIFSGAEVDAKLRDAKDGEV